MKNKIETIGAMLKIYCRAHHGRKTALCRECAGLLEYAEQRLHACPFKQQIVCSQCTVHCYEEEMRNRIKAVMRFSGPRILFYHPILAVRHLLELGRSKFK